MVQMESYEDGELIKMTFVSLPSSLKILSGFLKTSKNDQ